MPDDGGVRGAAEGYRLEDQVGFLLARAWGRGYRALRHAIADLDVTPPQFAAIMKLHDLGEASQNALGRAIGMKPATIHGIIGRLTARKLVQTRPMETDQRRKVLSLTAAGRALADELASRSRTVTAETLSIFDPKDRDKVHQLLWRLINRE